MDDMRIGLVFRRLRLRRGWPQADVARRAGISDSSYSEIERGHIGRISIWKLRRVAAVLEVRLDLEPRWRGASLDRLLSAGHAAMTERVAKLLVDAGWDVKPEVSFSHFGERGVVDLVARDAEGGNLLLVELKTEIVDVNNLLATTNRRHRLAHVIAQSCEWPYRSVSHWVVVLQSRTNQRRLADHKTAIRAAFPVDGRAVRGWLRDPREPIAAFWFLPDSSPRRSWRAPSAGRAGAGSAGAIQRAETSTNS
jgi:transcriptional regulator with XRE-family HTH domain